MTLPVSVKEARKERPNSPHTASKRSGNLRSFSGWSHRCYVIQPRRHNNQGVWKATNLFPALAGEIPKSFIWTARDDRDGLREYIDAVLTGRRSKSVAMERAGLVDAIEAFTIDRPNDISIRANVSRFVDFLTLRDGFDVPLWGKVHFITDGHKIVPIEFLAAVAQLFDPVAQKFYDLKKDWWHARESDLDRMGLRPEDVTSGMYRGHYQNAGIEAADAQGDDAMLMGDDTSSADDADPDTASTIPATTRQPPSVPAREIEISRRTFEKHAELITLVQPLRGRAYYTRRLMLLRGILLWAGTSYHPDGPWTVWERNAALLLSLGISD